VTINSPLTVLFCPVHSTSLQEMRAIALRLETSNSGRAIFLLSSKNAAKFGAILESDNIQYIVLENADDLRQDRPTSLLHRFTVWLIIRGIQPHVLLLRWVFKEFRALEFLREKAHELISRLNPAGVAVPDDRSFSGGLIPAVLDACRVNSIASVIVPISYGGGPDNLIFQPSRRNRKIGRDHWLCEKYPEQLYFPSQGSIGYSFYPLVETTLLAALDLLPQNPWVMGGSNSEWLMADGLEASQRFQQQGCIEEKIILTGHCSHDELYNWYLKRNEMAVNICQELGRKSPLITVALPQLGEHGLLPWDEHWQEIHYLCGVLQNWSDNIVISLHPKMDLDQYKFIETDYELQISPKSLRDILPASDLFIAGFSSTVKWAVVCQVPSLVVDFNGLNYSDFDDFGGVEIFKNKRKFESRLENLISNTGHRQKLADDTLETARLISPFDGQCSDRIVRFLTASPEKRREIAGRETAEQSAS
jgi:hypothetical protein